MGSEISKLVNRGYQQFLKTAKNEVPATADHLKALQQFTEELKEGLGLPSLYNESLGTVSESYQYDRIVDRDKPRPTAESALGSGRSEETRRQGSQERPRVRPGAALGPALAPLTSLFAIALAIARTPIPPGHGSSRLAAVIGPLSPS